MIQGKSKFIKKTTIGMFCVILLFLFACSQNAKSDSLIITMNWLGVRNGDQLKFYNIDKGFKQNPEYDFTLPDGANELIITMNWLGVRNGNELKFYNIDKGFKQNSEYDFQIP